MGGAGRARPPPLWGGLKIFGYTIMGGADFQMGGAKSIMGGGLALAPPMGKNHGVKIPWGKIVEGELFFPAPP